MLTATSSQINSRIAHSTHLLHTSNSNSERILAPPQQYALDGENATLNCTTNFPNAFITWLREEDDNNTVDIGDGIISDVSLEDEGMYICRVYLSHQDLIHTRRVQLRVISKYKVCLRIKKTFCWVTRDLTSISTVVWSWISEPPPAKRKRGLLNIFVASYLEFW